MDKKAVPILQLNHKLRKKADCFFNDVAHFLSILIVDGKSLGNLKKDPQPGTQHFPTHL